MNNLTQAAGVMQERFYTPFNIDKPEVATELFYIYGNYGLPELQIRKNMGFSKPVAQNHGTYFYADRPANVLHTAGPLSTVVAPAPGVSGVYSFVLDTTAGNNDLILGAVAPEFPQYPSGSYYYQPAVVGQGLSMPSFDSNVTGTITAISGTGTNTVTITFRVDLPNVALTTASYIQGTTIVPNSNAYAAGSEVPAGQMMTFLKDGWVTQFIQNSFEIDGEALTTQLWVETDSFGNKIANIRTPNMWQLDFSHARAIDQALWWGPGQLNPLQLDAASNSVVYKTEGTIPYTDRMGTQLNYPVGNLSPLLFDQIDSILVKNYTGKYYRLVCDNNFSNEFTNTMMDYFKFTQIDYVTKQAEADLFKNGSQTGKYAKVDFTYLEKNNRVYCKNVMFQFNDPTFKGAPGQDGTNFAWLGPVGETSDPKSPGNRIPYLGMYYKALGGYSRMGEVNARYGATNGQHQLGVDKNIITYKSQIASVQVGGQNMINIRGVI